MFYKNAVLMATLAASSSLAPTSALTAQIPHSTEVLFSTSPAGAEFYYDPNSVHENSGGKTGKVRIRIVYTNKIPQLFRSQPASSTETFVFDCTQRTYLIEDGRDFDRAGQPIPQRDFPVVVGIGPQHVTVDVEPVYEAACPIVAARPPTPPPAIDPNSEESRKALADELAYQRQQAVENLPSVTRRYDVGWELHYGYYLVPDGRPNEQITLDFLDRHVRDEFDVQMRQDVLALHTGERLQCECSGIAWNFYSDQRFIVQAADFRWIK